MPSQPVDQGLQKRPRDWHSPHSSFFSTPSQKDLLPSTSRESTPAGTFTCASLFPNSLSLTKHHHAVMNTSQVNKPRIDDVQIVEKEPDDGGIASRYRGTAADERDMKVLGKTQVLRVSDVNKPH
jgi:hypothetical protein